MQALMRALAEVFVIGFPIALILDFIDRGQFPKDREKKGQSVVLTPGLDIFSQIYAIKAEGHYARIYGPEGERLLDQSFNEMLELVSDEDGAQVHRSWWVAKACVQDVRRKGSAMEFVLTNGIHAPIARRRLAELRGKGWQI
jgi:DNA-binding LytR/AlgR family response regulator